MIIIISFIVTVTVFTEITACNVISSDENVHIFEISDVSDPSILN